jgi:excisionase family DNA binding protein
MTVHLEVVDNQPLMTPAEVASMFRVTPKTVTRWAEAGKLPVVRTLGGHRRFPAAPVHRLREKLDSAAPGGGAEPAPGSSSSARSIVRGVQKLEAVKRNRRR